MAAKGAKRAKGAEAEEPGKAASSGRASGRAPGRDLGSTSADLGAISASPPRAWEGLGGTGAGLGLGFGFGLGLGLGLGLGGARRHGSRLADPNPNPNPNPYPNPYPNPNPNPSPSPSPSPNPNQGRASPTLVAWEALENLELNLERSREEDLQRGKPSVAGVAARTAAG